MPWVQASREMRPERSREAILERQVGVSRRPRSRRDVPARFSLAFLSDRFDQRPKVKIRPRGGAPRARVREMGLAQIQTDFEGSFLMAEARSLQDGQNIGRLAERPAPRHHGFQLIRRGQRNRELDLLQLPRGSFNSPKLPADFFQGDVQGVPPWPSELLATS